MGEAIHNEKWPVVEKQQLWVMALHYSTMADRMASLVQPAHTLALPSSKTGRSNEEDSGADQGPENWC